MDVLVVNAGSSSLKLSLLNPADKVLAATEVEHWDSGGPPAALTSFLDGLPGVDAVGHRVVHGGPHLEAPAVIDATVRRADRGCHRPGPAASAPGPGRHRRGVPAAARGARRGLLRHRVPRRPARRGQHLRAARRLAGAVRAAPLRVPRPVARLRGPAGGRDARHRPRTAPHRVLPPRRGGLARGDRARPQRGHHDGLHPAGRAGDGDPGREHRPGPAALAAARRRPDRGRAGRGTGAPLGAGRPGRRGGHAGRDPGRGRRRSGRRPRPGGLPAPAAAADRGHGRGHGRPGRAGVHRRDRGAPARASAPGAHPPSWGSSWRSSATRPPRGTPTSVRPGRRSRRW